MTSQASVSVNKSALTPSESFTLVGSGFVPDEKVLVTIIGSSSRQVLGVVDANAAGAFSFPISDLGDTDPGFATLFAQGGNRSAASAPVEIVSEMRTVSSLRTDGGEPGGNATILGAGFVPNEFVSITMMGDVLIGGQANDTGAFSFVASISSSLDEGVYSIVAIGGNGSESSAAMAVASK